MFLGLVSVLSVEHGRKVAHEALTKRYGGTRVGDVASLV